MRATMSFTLARVGGRARADGPDHDALVCGVLIPKRCSSTVFPRIWIVGERPVTLSLRRSSTRR